MVFRPIDDAQANGVVQILEEECGYTASERGYDPMAARIIAPRSDGGHVCQEYRFGGALGFGGKFRNNGNNNNVPYVDCYQGHATKERLAMIERANERLRKLFGE
jgi:hypothetical protein